MGETRKRGLDGVDTLNDHRIGCHASRNGQRHRDAVIAATPGGPATEAAAMNNRSVRRFLDRDPQRAQTRRHRRNTVAFLHAQFADSRERRFAARRRRRDKQRRKLVNRQ